MKLTDCQPGSGNPTVRDERGAYGNVSYGGTRNPLHTPKGCRTETLCLRLRAPYFYPTSGACLQRGSAGTGESHLAPCHMPGMGDRVTTSPGGGRGGNHRLYPEADGPQRSVCVRRGSVPVARRSPRALGSLAFRFVKIAHGSQQRSRCHADYPPDTAESG